MKRVLTLMSLLLLALAAPVRAATLSPLDPVLVDNTYSSISSSQTAIITFVNEAGFAVDVYWIDFSGNRVLYGTIAPGGSFVQGTYITHPWLIVRNGTGSTAQGSGQLIAAFTAVTANPANPAAGDAAYIVQPQVAVPTLSEYGLAGLAILLAGVGGFALSRRKGCVRAVAGA